MLCADHRVMAPVILFLWIEAMNRRSSEVSILVEEPEATCLMGKVVVGTVRFRLPDIDGVPPGSDTRRSTSRLNRAMSAPMMYPCVACGSSLSTPRGANGPPVTPPDIFVNGVTTIGPPPRRLDFRTT